MTSRYVGDKERLADADREHIRNLLDSIRYTLDAITALLEREDTDE